MPDNTNENDIKRKFPFSKVSQLIRNSLKLACEGSECSRKQLGT